MGSMVKYNTFLFSYLLTFLKTSNYIYKKYFNVFYMYNYIIKSSLKTVTINLLLSLKYTLFRYINISMELFTHNSKSKTSLKVLNPKFMLKKSLYIDIIKTISLPCLKTKFNNFLYLK